MSAYAQNNFKQSAVAKQSESSKSMLYAGIVAIVGVAITFAYAFNG